MASSPGCAVFLVCGEPFAEPSLGGPKEALGLESRQESADKLIAPNFLFLLLLGFLRNRFGVLWGQVSEVKVRNICKTGVDFNHGTTL